MRVSIVVPVAWGGSSDDETFLDSLVEIQKLAPSASFRIVEAYPNHSGGWPLVEITVNEAELSALDSF